jgi:hypothetical protein
MARARNIKPGFFINDDLVELPFSTRLLFIGLWTIADREGRLDDRPKKIKMAVFPADEVDVNEGLIQLENSELIERYVVDSKPFIQITNFLKHQNPHVKEQASVIPAPCKPCASTVQATPLTDSLNTDSLSSDSPHTEHVREPDDFQPFVETVLEGVRTELDLNVVRDESGWVDACQYAYQNKFSVDHFLETFRLMRQQKWRKGRITPANVADNLSELEKIRAEIKEQDDGTNNKPTSEREKSSQRVIDSERLADEIAAGLHNETVAKLFGRDDENRGPHRLAS